MNFKKVFFQLSSRQELPGIKAIQEKNEIHNEVNELIIAGSFNGGAWLAFVCGVVCKIQTGKERIDRILLCLFQLSLLMILISL